MNISVLLEVPAEIVRGLSNGTLERIGGVIREVGTKRTVLWLRDAGNAGKVATSTTVVAGQAAVSFGMIGLQAGALCLMAYSFMQIGKRLDELDRNISTIDSQLKKIGHNLEFLKDIILSFNQANLHNACQLADTAWRQGKAGDIRRPREIFGKCAWQSLLAMEKALTHNIGTVKVEVFVESMKVFVVATQALARCEWHLNGSDSAIQIVNELLERSDRAFDRFNQSLTNPSLDPDLFFSLDRAVRDRLCVVLPEMVEQMSRLHGYVAEIESVSRFSIDAKTWQEMLQTQIESPMGYVCIVPANDTAVAIRA